MSETAPAPLHRRLAELAQAEGDAGTEALLRAAAERVAAAGGMDLALWQVRANTAIKALGGYLQAARLRRLN